MKELKAGDQCEHRDKVGDPYTSYKWVNCETRHLGRIDGKPQMLYVVKKQFLCRKHLPHDLLKRMGF